jgi:hypothetical protein
MFIHKLFWHCFKLHLSSLLPKKINVLIHQTSIYRYVHLQISSYTFPMLLIMILENTYLATMVLFLKPFSIFVINKSVGSLPIIYQRCILSWSTHLYLYIFLKAFKGLESLTAATYTFIYFFWTCSTFSSRNLCTFAISYILSTIFWPQFQDLHVYQIHHTIH